MQLQSDAPQITNTSSSSANSLSGVGNRLTQDDFMKLLLAQMKSQSPTNPFDSNTMMQQVSQLTALSATQQLEQTVSEMRDNMDNSQILDASRVVGKQVQIPSEQGYLSAKDGLKGAVALPDNVDNVLVTIRNSNDQIVKKISLGSNASGLKDFTWNGIDEKNKSAPPGNYKISAEAVINGQFTAVPTVGTFNVSSVAMDKNNKQVVLNLEGIGSARINDIVKIL